MSQLFDPGPARPVEILSATQRLTRRNNDLLAAGTHPATGRTLDKSHTCGQCAHHVATGKNRTYHKCKKHRLGQSHGAATDIRLSWPACTLFTSKED